MTRASLLVDHGSRLADANAILAELAARVRARLAAGATQIAIHPHFLGPGRHTTRDIPRLVRDAAARHPGVTWKITPPLGAHEKLVDLILERVAEAGW